MPRPLSVLIPLFGSLVLVLCSTGCGVKGKLEEETQQLRSVVMEKKMEVKRLEMESASVGNLGRYDIPRVEYLSELKDRLASLKRDGARLVAERETKAQSLKRMEDELSAYQTKFPSNN
ncbi:MAG: hypothetical protein U0984_05890 [Prosthecobacter sp.]|nr:hypothetical protein [Prosthecobacter sp.]